MGWSPFFTLLLLLFSLGIGFPEPAYAQLPAAPPLDFFGELWKMAQQAGPFASLMLLWLYLRTDSRAERLAKEKDAMTKETTQAIHALEIAVQSLREFFGRGHT